MKLKFSIKTTFKYLYIVLILANAYLAFLAYDFANVNVYKTMFPDENISIMQNRKYSEDLDVDNFNKIINKIKQKSDTTANFKPAPQENQATSTADNLQ